mmetsp:Transcript_105920/g.188390  ORF Transcript_105920/g.188390 Transcript_105920/m.188390 type:complete len:252 (+) Transcript_105920:226-981(+)
MNSGKLSSPSPSRSRSLTSCEASSSVRAPSRCPSRSSEQSRYPDASLSKARKAALQIGSAVYFTLSNVAAKNSVYPKGGSSASSSQETPLLKEVVLEVSSWKIAAVFASMSGLGSFMASRASLISRTVTKPSPSASSCRKRSRPRAMLRSKSKLTITLSATRFNLFILLKPRRLAMTFQSRSFSCVLRTRAWNQRVCKASAAVGLLSSSYNSSLRTSSMAWVESVVHSLLHVYFPATTFSLISNSSPWNGR